MIGVGISLTEIAVRKRAAFDADAQAWFDAVVGNGGSVSAARKILVNTFVRDFKTAGIWTQSDRIWLLAAENGIAGRTCLKSFDLATEVNSPTFTVDEGYTGNGTTSYLDSLFDPSVDGVAYTLNAAHFSCYIRNNRTAAAATVAMGVQDLTPAAHEVALYPLFTGPVVHARLNENAASGPSQGTTQGLWLIDRADASNKSWNRNGSSFHAVNTAPVALPNFTIFIGAKNNSNVAGQFSSEQIAVVTIGGHLTTQQIADHATIIEAYMDALGKGVI